MCVVSPVVVLFALVSENKPSIALHRPMSDSDVDFDAVATVPEDLADAPTAHPPVAEAIVPRAPEPRCGQGFGKPAERTCAQHAALCRVMRAEKRARASRIELEESRVALEKNARMVARKNPRWFSNLREMRGAMDVAFSGIINASVCAKVFKLSRTTVTTVWRAIACAARLAQTALLVLMYTRT